MNKKNYRKRCFQFIKNSLRVHLAEYLIPDIGNEELIAHDQLMAEEEKGRFLQKLESSDGE